MCKKNAQVKKYGRRENFVQINVITDYVYALDTLDRYDYQSLRIEKTTSEESFCATYDNAMNAIFAATE